LLRPSTLWGDRMITATDLGFIHRLVPGQDASLAPLLLLHGSGGDESDLLPLGAQIGPGRALLSPRGKVNEHGITRFFRRSDDGAWDVGDFKRRTDELADFTLRATAAYRMQKPVALGYSNGANIAWSLLLKDPGLLKAAILLRAMLPFDPRPLPDLNGIPVLLIAATHDELLAALLGEAGADVTYEVLPVSHGLIEEDVALAAEWLARHG
jgi:phospholipase/carboxylesterase